MKKIFFTFSLIFVSLSTVQAAPLPVPAELYVNHPVVGGTNPMWAIAMPFILAFGTYLIFAIIRNFKKANITA